MLLLRTGSLISSSALHVAAGEALSVHIQRQFYSNSDHRQASCNRSGSNTNHKDVCLRHIELRDTDSSFVDYDYALDIQERLRAEFLQYKARASRGAYSDDKSVEKFDAPYPTLISFVSKPVYTLGRRQNEETFLTEEDKARLTAPLHVPTSRIPTKFFRQNDHTESNNATRGYDKITESNNDSDETIISMEPTLRKSLRGGQMTYHGPGQIVFWPVIDLISPLYANGPFSVRCYAHLLEEVTRSVLKKLHNIETHSNEDEPGVWTYVGRDNRTDQVEGSETPKECKIAAMGVHLRRHISGLGTALNVYTRVKGSPGYNPWSRFVPCGIEGKTVTSVEQVKSSKNPWTVAQGTVALENLRQAWAHEFAKRIGVNGVKTMTVA